MVVYKSKDVKYMNALKQAVFAGMPDTTLEEKMQAWETTRKQITLDDLHSYAIEKLGELVEFPTSGFNGKMMVILRKPPKMEEMDIITKMFTSQGIPMEDVYVTFIQKTREPREKCVVSQTIVEAEVRVLQPKAIVSFGMKSSQGFNQFIEYQGVKTLPTYDLHDIINAPDEETRNARKIEMWNGVKQLIQYYKM